MSGHVVPPKQSVPTRVVCEALEPRKLLSASLVREINTTTLPSDPQEVVNVNGAVFFDAYDPVHGTRLWETNAAGGGAVIVNAADGTAVTRPANLTAVGGTLYFAGFDQDNVFGLWKLDPRSASAVMLKREGPSVFSYLPYFTAVNDTLFFVASDADHGYELWKSDGTVAGTTLVREIIPGAAGAPPRNLINVSGTLFFTAGSGVGQAWRSDGTAAGTQPLWDSSSPTANDAVVAGGDGSPYFTTAGTLKGARLWKSDGTVAGTKLVVSIDASKGLYQPTVANGTTYFLAKYSGSPNRLFQTDDTAAGTAEISLPDMPTGLVAAGGKLFLTTNSYKGAYLWSSDGTTLGTVLLSSASSLPTAVNDTVFFAGYNDELWKSDGTVAGTEMVKDIAPGDESSFPRHLTAADGMLYFVAYDPVHAARNPTPGTELWRSDGTAEGTTLVQDINTASADAFWTRLPEYSPPYTRPNGVNVNGTVYYAATDGFSGEELWKSDGTAAGTVLVKDSTPGPHPYAGEGRYQRSFLNAGGVLYFISDSTLWKSDGTAAGTLAVRQSVGTTSVTGIAGAPVTLLAYAAGITFFSGYDYDHGTELWKTDGTPAGTVLVKDINPGYRDSNASAFVVVGRTVYFLADDGVHGRELWKTDGTTEGTVLVKDIAPPGAFDSKLPDDLTAVGGTLFFTADDGVHGRELWKSDGTAEGTVMVSDLLPGTSGFGLENALVGMNGVLYFLAGSALYRSDGTASGTSAVKDVTADSGGARLTNANGTLFFFAIGPQGGSYLWRSDGTAAGTVPLKPASNSFYASGWMPLASAGGHIYYSMSDSTHGYELWTSDGTPEGTLMVQDLNAGAASSSPDDFVATDDALYFTADDGVHGRELFKLPLDPPGINALPGAAYTLTGPPGQQVLSVTAGTVSVTADLSASYPNLSVQASNGASVVFNATQHLAGLTLSGGAKATLAGVGAGRTATGHRILVVGALSIDAASGSSLDLGDNDLIFRGGGAAGLASIQSLISSGYDKDKWDGRGVVSSAAAGKTTNALGYALNDGSVIKAKTTFGPNDEPVGPSDVLVKYTYEGDANLDGVVSFDDYFYIDSKYPRPSNSTWVTGDFDYNGQTSFDDYFYIDSNYPRNTPL